MSSHDDNEAIIRAINLYAYALDERRWDWLDEVFAADAVARYGSEESPLIEGREAIVTSIRSYLDGCGPSQHLFGNHLVELDGDTATTRVKARVYHYGRGERARLTPFENFGVYRDRFQRGPDGWRIVERLFDVYHVVGDIDILQPA